MTLHPPSLHPLERALPVLALLRPREQTRNSLAALVLSLALGLAGTALFRWPSWATPALVLAALIPVGIAKWRTDWRRFGAVLTLVGVLLTAQGLHSVEHIVQWVQNHVFNLTLRESTGLLSPANAEWVHFVWNTTVLLTVAAIVAGGVRSPFAWALLAIAVLHSIEHTYTFVRYLQVLADLQQLGITNVTAQALPGIVGRDGWLARSPLTQSTFLCGLPGLTTATRLDVHFWWNVIEMSFLLAAAHVHLRTSWTAATDQATRRR